MNSENLAKFYVIEIKIFICFCGGGGRGKKGVKMGLSFIKLLKTNVEKMSAFRLAIML
jgi:hypothetical protein